MPDLELPLPNDDPGLVDAPPQGEIDMDALAEKIVALLKRELEREAERFANVKPNR